MFQTASTFIPKFEANILLLIYLYNAEYASRKSNQTSLLLLLSAFTIFVNVKIKKL